MPYIEVTADPLSREEVINILKNGEKNKIQYKKVWSPVNELASMIYGHFADRGDGVPRKEIIEKIQGIHVFTYPKAQIYKSIRQLVEHEFCRDSGGLLFFTSKNSDYK